MIFGIYGDELVYNYEYGGYEFRRSLPDIMTQRQELEVNIKNIPHL